MDYRHLSTRNPLAFFFVSSLFRCDYSKDAAIACHGGTVRWDVANRGLSQEIRTTVEQELARKSYNLFRSLGISHKGAQRASVPGLNSRHAGDNARLTCSSWHPNVSFRRMDHSVSAGIVGMCLMSITCSAEHPFLIAALTKAVKHSGFELPNWFHKRIVGDPLTNPILRVEDGLLLAGTCETKGYGGAPVHLRPEYIGIKDIGVYKTDIACRARFDSFPAELAEILLGKNAVNMSMHESMASLSPERKAQVAMEMLTGRGMER